ncbi:hypothetical protein CDAR_93681 [Caerostris darwini]|uniref:Uncharacterized protein n=1 Tax=Caerostris darwini TaxID=1538125 RepID=A0AAV4NL38_9ARAC|nr:hypothetical protein CDAR_93681 [Caerostris darwini]
MLRDVSQQIKRRKKRTLSEIFKERVLKIIRTQNSFLVPEITPVISCDFHSCTFTCAFEKRRESESRGPPGNVTLGRALQHAHQLQLKKRKANTPVRT